MAEAHAGQVIQRLQNLKLNHIKKEIRIFIQSIKWRFSLLVPIIFANTLFWKSENKLQKKPTLYIVQTSTIRSSATLQLKSIQKMFTKQSNKLTLEPPQYRFHT